MTDTPSSSAFDADQGAPLSLEALMQGQQSLRRALNVTLIMLLVLTASLFVFFLREVSLARRQIADLGKVVAEYEKTTHPAMESFRSKLQAFSVTHPDFSPIYVRYFGAGTNMALGHSPIRTSSNSSPARLPPGAGQ